MSHSLFFLTGTRLTSEVLDGCLNALNTPEGQKPPELRVGPHTRVSTSPWTLWPIEGEPEALSAVTGALVDVSTALAVLQNHQVIALSLPPAGEDAVLSRAVPGQDAELVTADRARIAATLALWLEVPVERVGVALGLIEAGQTPPDEPADATALEEEDFIARKLEEARRWMAQWVRESNKET